MTPDDKLWLHSLGLTNAMIQQYGLDRTMARDAWVCMVNDAIRNHGNISRAITPAHVHHSNFRKGKRYANRRNRPQQSA